MTAKRGEPARRLTMRRDRRIRKSADFDAAYLANVRRSAGPLLIYARPNGLDFSRLGMAVSRRVGGAVVRNSIRRRIREAFRQAQHDLPCGYDFVVSVRLHEAMKTADYQRLLTESADALHTKWTRKQQKSDLRSPPGR